MPVEKHQKNGHHKLSIHPSYPDSPEIGRAYLLSNTQGLLFDRSIHRGKEHLYLYCSQLLIINLWDVGSLSIQAGNWVDVTFCREKTIYALNQPTPILIYVWATDFILSLGSTVPNPLPAVPLLDDAGGPALQNGTPAGIPYAHWKSLQSKVGGFGNIVNTVPGDMQITFTTFPQPSLAPGMRIRAGNDIVIVADGYVPGPNFTIPLKNPIVVGGTTSANWDKFGYAGPIGSGYSVDGVPITAIGLQGGAPVGGNLFTLFGASQDGISPFNAASTLAYNFSNAQNSLYRNRTNDNFTIFNDSTYTGTQTTGTTIAAGAFQNLNWRGIKITFNVIAIGASAGLVLTVLGVVPTAFASAYTFTLFTSAAVVGNSINVYTIYPGVTPVANVAISDVLPDFYAISVTGASSTEFRVDGLLQL